MRRLAGGASGGWPAGSEAGSRRCVEQRLPGTPRTAARRRGGGAAVDEVSGADEQTRALDSGPGTRPGQYEEVGRRDLRLGVVDVVGKSSESVLSLSSSDYRGLRVRLRDAEEAVPR